MVLAIAPAACARPLHLSLAVASVVVRVCVGSAAALVGATVALSVFLAAVAAFAAVLVSGAALV